MARTPLLSVALASALLMVAGCGDDVDSTTSDSTPSAPTSSSDGTESFDRTRHIVLENPVSDGFETVTALAHVCDSDDSSCPDGTEEVIILASYRFSPGRIYTHDPEMTLVPPDDCLRDDIRCGLSVSHCEYPDFSTQMEAQHCVPPPTPIDTTSGPTGQCNESAADYSHHIDFGCLTNLSSVEQGDS